MATPLARTGHEEPDGDEDFRVHVPEGAMPRMDRDMESGWMLVKFETDDGGVCLRLDSLRMPDAQPMEGDEMDGDTLEGALKKIVDKDAVKGRGVDEEDEE